MLKIHSNSTSLPYISQLKEFIPQLPNNWIKEKLSQNVRFFSGKTPLDSFLEEQNKKYRYNQDVKTIDEGVLKNLFSLAVTSCFTNCHVTPKKVVVGGEVSTDGWGDLSQMWFTGKNLSEDLPECDVSVFANLMGRAPPAFVKSNKVTDLTFASKEEHEKKGVNKGYLLADMIVNIPHGYLPNPNKKPIFRVEEYGFSASSGDFAMGLDPMYEDIIGIQLMDVSGAESLEQLSQASLKSHLAAKKDSFFLGYLKKDHGDKENHRAGFVLAAAASQIGKSQDIAIVCPYEDLQQLDVEALKACQIKSVVLMESVNGVLTKKQTLSLQTEGKEICILNPFPLSNEDWMILLKFSAPLVGCTGDMSLSEVISNGKIPFYPPRWHKAQFMEQLQKIGFTYHDEFPQLLQFFQLLEKLPENGSLDNLSNNCKKMGLLSNSLVLEAQNFAAKIRAFYCARHPLASRVKQALVYAAHPHLKKIEEQLFEDWKQNAKTLKECIDEFVTFVPKMI